jgi:hypothetical protein
MNRRAPIIAVDFDGTITMEHCFPHTSPPNEKVVEKLRKFHDMGCIIILWTCREGFLLDIAKDYCKEYNIPIDYYNENAPYVQPDMRKIFADFYIDDKGFMPLSADLDEIEVYLNTNDWEPWIIIGCEEKN